MNSTTTTTTTQRGTSFTQRTGSGPELCLQQLPVASSGWAISKALLTRLVLPTAFGRPWRN